MASIGTLSDWQKLGLTKPSGTAYEEHNAVGDVSTGRRFKAVQDVPSTSRVTTDGTYFYIAESKPGTATSSALWRVSRIDSSGNELFADGDDLFDNIADNYATLTYL